MDEGFLKNINNLVTKPKPTSDYSENIAVATLPLIGRVHIVKDRNGQLQVLGVLLYWVYGTFVTLFIILLPQYYDGHCPGSVIGGFLFVSVMTLLSLIKASITNPGRIPLLTEESGIDTSDWTFCRTCNRKRPKRSHHCRRCQQCVMRMDHHCPWINNCVGEENHFAFFLLILYSFLLGTSTFALSMLHFWVWPKCISCNKEAFHIKHSIWFLYLLVLLAVNMSMMMFIQLSHLNFNLLLDVTTLETMQSAYTIPNATLRKTYAAYRDLCGRTSIIFWWWPCRRRYPVLSQNSYNV